MLKIGESVFYPAHGVAAVTAIEKHDFGGSEQKFYVLEISRGGRSMVPVGNVEQERLRPLISQRKARTLIKDLKNKPNLENTKSWKERANAYSEGLKSGDAERYTGILRELAYRSLEDKLSATEQKMLDTARSYFVSEISTVLKQDPDKVDASIVAVLGSAP